MLQAEPPSSEIILVDQAGPRSSSAALAWPAGPRELRLPPGEAHVWSAWLDASPERSEVSWPMLSPDERERAQRFRFPADRSRFAAARCILRTLAGRYLGIAGASLRFRYGPFGKPALHGCHGSGLRFNLAHSGEMALFAFTGSQEVGLDLEAEHSTRLPAEAPGSSFTAAEQKALAALPPDRRGLATIALWTRKEAYVKALGCGLQQDLSRFEVSVPPVPPALLTAPDGLGEGNWFLYDLSPARNFVGTLCVENEAKISTWSWQG